MVSTIRLELSAVALTASLAAALIANAQQDEATLDRTPVSCVSAARIRRTEHIDDRTILFVMRGDRSYRNILREECRDLERPKSIGYDMNSSRLAQICNGHPIYPSESDFTCALGEFEPITSDEARELATTKDKQPATEPARK